MDDNIVSTLEAMFDTFGQQSTLTFKAMVDKLGRQSMLTFEAMFDTFRRQYSVEIRNNGRHIW